MGYTVTGYLWPELNAQSTLKTIIGMVAIALCVTGNNIRSVQCFKLRTASSLWLRFSMKGF